MTETQHRKEVAIDEEGFEDIEARPELRVIVDKLRADAVAWAERRERTSPEVIVRELGDDGRVVAEWNADDLLARDLGASRKGTPAPSSRLADAALAFFRSRAGHRLAELCLAQTGLAAQDVADAVALTPTLDKDSPRPPVIERVLAWLVEHTGAAEARRVTRGELGFRFLLAFVSIAREEAEARAEAAEKRLAEIKRPMLRQGIGTLRAWMRTETHVEDARRRAQSKGVITKEQAEGRKLFQYQPLGWAERLVMHALATIAREHGLLDHHPWAVAAKPIYGHQPAPKVRIRFPGLSELARLLGYEPDADGKVSRETRRTLERALKDLTQKPRWIATPVLVPLEKPGHRKKNGEQELEFIEDVEVKQTLWVEVSETLGLHDEITRGVWLDLHPAAVMSHVKSFVDIPDLAKRYEDARKALSARQMRDEWAIADDYLRLLAVAAAGEMRRKALRATAGASVAVGDLQIQKRVAFDTVVRSLGLEKFAKKQGAKATRERVAEAWQFCVQLGSLVSFSYAEKEQMYDLVLPHPDRKIADDAQLLLLAADGEVGLP